MGEKINKFVESFNKELDIRVSKQLENDKKYKELRDTAIRNSSLKLGKWPDDPNVKTIGDLLKYVFPENRFSKFRQPQSVLGGTTANPEYIDFIKDVKNDSVRESYEQLMKLIGGIDYNKFKTNGGGQYWFDLFMKSFYDIVSKDDNFISKSVDEIKNNTGSYAISRFDNKIKDGTWMINKGRKTSDYLDYILFYSYLINENDLNNYRSIELSILNLAEKRGGLDDNEDEIIKPENKDKRNSDLLYQAFLEAGDSYSGPNTKKIDDLNSDEVKEQLVEKDKISESDKTKNLEEVPKETISGTPSATISGTPSSINSVIESSGYIGVTGKYSTIYIPDIPKNHSTVISAVIFYPSDLVNNREKSKPVELKDYKTYKLSDSVKGDFYLYKEDPISKPKDKSGATFSYDLYKSKTIYGKFEKGDWGKIILPTSGGTASGLSASGTASGWIIKSSVVERPEYNSMLSTLTSIIPDWFKKYVIVIPNSETVDYKSLKAEIIRETENKYIKHKDLNLLTVSTSINSVDNQLSDFKNIMIVDPFVLEWDSFKNKIDKFLETNQDGIYMIYNLDSQIKSDVISGSQSGTQSGTQSKSSLKSTVSKKKSKSTVKKERSFGDEYTSFLKQYDLILNNKISEYSSKISEYNKIKIEAIKISDPYTDSTGKKIDFPKDCNTVGEAFSKIFPDNDKYSRNAFPTLEDQIKIRDLILDKYKVGEIEIFKTLYKNSSSFFYIKNLNHIKDHGGAIYWMDLFYKTFSEFIIELRTSDEDIKKIDYFDKLRNDSSYYYFLEKLKKSFDEYIDVTISNSFISNTSENSIKSSLLQGSFLNIYLNRNSLPFIDPTGLSASTVVPVTDLSRYSNSNKIEELHETLLLGKNSVLVSEESDPLIMMEDFFSANRLTLENSLTTFIPSADTEDNRNKESVLDGSIKCDLKIIGLDENPNGDGYHLVINSGEELPEIRIELIAKFNPEDEYKMSRIKINGLGDEYLDDDYIIDNTNINDSTGSLYTEEDLKEFEDSGFVEIGMSLDEPKNIIDNSSSSNDVTNLEVGKGPMMGSKLLNKAGDSMINLAGHRLKNIPADLQNYLRANGFPGTVIGSNGIMRNLKESTYPNSKARVPASFHGCGLAHDLKFNIPGISWSGIGSNSNLASNQKLNLVIWEWTKKQGDLEWGGQWGVNKGTNNDAGVVNGWGVTEYHHFQIKPKMNYKYWEPVKEELDKLGFKTTDFTANGKGSNLYKLMIKLAGG